MAQGYKLSLDGPAFNSLKTDFDRLLTTTIAKMQDKGVEDATITVKLDINLMTEGNPNVNAPNSPAEQEYIAPEFKHKVTAAMQEKQEASGKTGGKKYELIWDGKGGAFVMQKVSDNPNQMEIWDQSGYGGENQTEGGVHDAERDMNGDLDGAPDSMEHESDAVSEALAEKAIQAAAAVVREAGTASVALLQRKMKIGYRLAAALLDKLEEQGVVGPFNGSAPRQVLPYVIPKGEADDTTEQVG